eukprot:1142851-Pelagomonas_calceolata.AAC.10
MNGMHTNRHHVGLSFCVKALNKGWYGSSLIGMNACQEKLLELGIESPESISRAFPVWVFPTGTSSSARNQSRPDAVFARSIRGRSAHLDPTEIPPRDRDRVTFILLTLKYAIIPTPSSLWELGLIGGAQLGRGGGGRENESPGRSMADDPPGPH